MNSDNLMEDASIFTQHLVSLRVMLRSRAGLSFVFLLLARVDMPLCPGHHSFLLCGAYNQHMAGHTR